MIKLVLILISFHCLFQVHAQILDIDPEIVTEDHEIELVDVRNYLIDINTASAEELASLNFLDNRQVFELIEHRRSAGNLIDLLELQVIPSFDQQTIQSILPFVKLKTNLLDQHKTGVILFKGSYSFVSRFEMQWPRAYAYADTSKRKYQGSPVKQLLRFDYSFKKHFTYGFQLQKDAGESNPADYFSAYLTFESDKFIEKLIIGDYDVNVGQGLICWTGFGIGKGVPPMMIKRISPNIKNYRSSDENHFFRGFALSTKIKEFHSYAYYSRNQVDVTIATVDSSDGKVLSFSSIRNSGMHRNASEISGKNAVSMRSAGIGFSVKRINWHFGYNFMVSGFDAIWLSREKFRNWSSWIGKPISAHSVDYHFHYHNMHFFGEFAYSTDIALLNGAIISLHENYAVSILHRYYSPKFYAYYSSAFSESASVGNENGIYFGQIIEITDRITFNLGVDFYEFPDLSSQIDFPAKGFDLSMGIAYERRRKLGIGVKFKMGRSEIDGPLSDNKVKSRSFQDNIASSLSLQSSFNSSLEWRSDISFKWFKEGIWNSGMYIGQEIIYKPFAIPMDFIARLAIFDSKSNSSKIYSRERDVLYGYSAPSYIGKGIRFYILTKVDIGKKIDLWIRYSVVSYPGSEIVTLGSEHGDASNPNAIPSNKVSEIKVQFRLQL
ncbi:MAG: helix-hairpin-helix domain-containing protein [Chitinophagales bacterium]|nr:helix-hairpin-helix domain-containing protein [Chitinophagales bacterium]